ncbi:FMN-dependent NADH-azoreductase [Rhizobium sp. 32-5/1]|uniref:FMN-dependent NADH-azoreductase n=1 Tax=Rhizobium sp. 32-5/1 TaxID=3019602 RepID=UPI00240DD2F5|nr:FMN-dependent NADH-azoreductase [Rhizobium sp. 32-5/1]WEZ83736.1 FMN-dependent NADH-azoreductase [Rhizobium sp. 32-5/1]
MNVLHIDSGILGDHSVSRRLTASIVARLKAQTEPASVTYRDLVAAPLAHLSGAHLMAASAGPEGIEASLASELDAGRTALEEFLAADVVVIGAPMYNFAVPTQLKTWIDRILVAGTTFRYTETGVEGLAKGKKVIVASTRGGHYSGASPVAAMDHQEAYLTTVLGFIGITDVEFIRAEGLAMGDDAKQSAIAGAEKVIAEHGQFATAA